MAEQNAVYGDNWAGWINANIAIASEKDRWGDNSIIGGEWCEPANGWLDFNDYGSIHSDLDRLGL